MTRNAERSATTRARLLDVAASLFARDGYAATSTESILEGAGVRRGALYHHFADKSALFESVCISLSEKALPLVEEASAAAVDPLDMLVRGSVAWIEFITRADVRRILIVDAPTVLGWERWEALDRRLSYQSLCDGVDAALAAGVISFDGSPELLATMINGALNAVALRVGAPGVDVPSEQWQQAVRALLGSLAPPATAAPRTRKRRVDSR